MIADEGGGRDGRRARSIVAPFIEAGAVDRGVLLEGAILHRHLRIREGRMIDGAAIAGRRVALEDAGIEDQFALRVVDDRTAVVVLTIRKGDSVDRGRHRDRGIRMIVQQRRGVSAIDRDRPDGGAGDVDVIGQIQRALRQRDDLADPKDIRVEGDVRGRDPIRRGILQRLLVRRGLDGRAQGDLAVRVQRRTSADIGGVGVIGRVDGENSRWLRRCPRTVRRRGRTRWREGRDRERAMMKRWAACGGGGAPRRPVNFTAAPHVIRRKARAGLAHFTQNTHENYEWSVKK